MDKKNNKTLLPEFAVSLDGKVERASRVCFTPSLHVLNAFLNSMQSQMSDLFNYEKFSRGYELLYEFLKSFELSIIGDAEIYDSYAVFELIE